MKKRVKNGGSLPSITIYIGVYLKTSLTENQAQEISAESGTKTKLKHS